MDCLIHPGALQPQNDNKHHDQIRPRRPQGPVQLPIHGIPRHLHLPGLNQRGAALPGLNHGLGPINLTHSIWPNQPGDPETSEHEYPFGQTNQDHSPVNLTER